MDHDSLFSEWLHYLIVCACTNEYQGTIFGKLHLRGSDTPVEPELA